MKLELPVYQNPAIKALNCFAMPASVIQAQGEGTENYFFLKMIGIYAKKKNALGKNEKSVLVPRCLPFPFWRALHFRLSPYYPKKDVKRCLIRTLTAQRYPLICVNEQYIPDRDAYQQYYYYHEILIYGYDDEHDCFLTMGYDKSGKYAAQEVPADTLLKAYQTNKLRAFSFYQIWRRKHVNLRAVPLPLLKAKLHAYLHPRRKNYGYKAYAAYTAQMQETFQDKTVDFRSFRTIADRAALYAAAPFLQAPAYAHLQPLITENKALAERLMLKAIKYTMVKKNEALEQELRRDIETMAANEKRILQALEKQIPLFAFKRT